MEMATKKQKKKKKKKKIVGGGGGGGCAQCTGPGPASVCNNAC